MLIVSGCFRYEPAAREGVRAGLAAFAKRARTEDGCLGYWWSEDVEEPNCFRAFEIWESEEQFNVHRLPTNPNIDHSSSSLSSIVDTEVTIYDVASSRMIEANYQEIRDRGDQAQGR